MDLSKEQLNELKKLMSYTITEKIFLTSNYPNQYLNLDNGAYIDANPKKAGCRSKWITEKSGYKHTVLVEDLSLITGDNWGSYRPANCCRLCGEEIKPYTNIYFKKINERYGDYWLKAYGFNNAYCEHCAKAQEAIENKPPKAPKLLRDYSQQLAGDKYPTRILEFEGFTVESNDAYTQKYKRS